MAAWSSKTHIGDDDCEDLALEIWHQQESSNNNKAFVVIRDKCAHFLPEHLKNWGGVGWEGSTHQQEEAERHAMKRQKFLFAQNTVLFRK